MKLPKGRKPKEKGKGKVKANQNFASVSLDKVGDYIEFKVRVSEDFFATGTLESLMRALGNGLGGGGRLLAKGIKADADSKKAEEDAKKKSEEELLLENGRPSSEGETSDTQ